MTAAASVQRPVVLILADHFLPGFKAGGPVRTLANLVQNLGDEFEFKLITRDRDMGAATPYADVRIDSWNQVGKASVYYASPRMLRFFSLVRLMRQTGHDLLYVNSFFSPRMTVLPLFARRLGLLPRVPTIIAPRGELASAALAIKPGRKRGFRLLARWAGLYGGLWWQATGAQEAERIGATAGPSVARVRIAPNLPVGSYAREVAPAMPRPQVPLQAVFVARLAPMKNLDFLIQRLCQVRAPLHLGVYGPVGDAAYWARCQDAARRLPPQITIAYHGELQPDQVHAAFARHDVLLFPSRGENFGHVIFESLAAGTPVIVSDRTPWVADRDGALTVLSLDRPRDWVDAIEAWARCDPAMLTDRRAAALRYAQRYRHDSDAPAAMRNLFFAALAEAQPSRASRTR